MVVDAAIRALIADRSLDDLTKTWLKPVFDADPERIPVILAK